MRLYVCALRDGGEQRGGAGAFLSDYLGMAGAASAQLVHVRPPALTQRRRGCYIWLWGRRLIVVRVCV